MTMHWHYDEYGFCLCDETEMAAVVPTKEAHDRKEVRDAIYRVLADSIGGKVRDTTFIYTLDRVVDVVMEMRKHD